MLCQNDLRLINLLTSLDSTSDSRESLYFGITLPENGVLFENPENLTPYFIGTLRGFAGICRFPYFSPDYASFGLIKEPETLDFIGFADLKDAT